MKTEHGNTFNGLCNQMMKNALNAAGQIEEILAEAKKSRRIDPVELETIKTLNGIICAYLDGTK